MTDQPRRILIVDDEENVCHALRRSLRKEGYELFFGHEPAEGLALLKKQPVDMVISDHLMPNMTGLEFLKLVRDRYPDAMRLMLTGHADMQTAIDAINQGNIYRFLTKPWDDTELKVTLFLAFEQLGFGARKPPPTRQWCVDSSTSSSRLEVEHPGIGHVVRDEDGAIRQHRRRRPRTSPRRSKFDVQHSFVPKRQCQAEPRQTRLDCVTIVAVERHACSAHQPRCSTTWGLRAGRA